MDRAAAEQANGRRHRRYQSYTSPAFEEFVQVCRIRGIVTALRPARRPDFPNAVSLSKFDVHMISGRFVQMCWPFK